LRVSYTAGSRARCAPTLNYAPSRRADPSQLDGVSPRARNLRDGGHGTRCPDSVGRDCSDAAHIRNWPRPSCRCAEVAPRSLVGRIRDIASADHLTVSFRPVCCRRVTPSRPASRMLLRCARVTQSTWPIWL